jgi:hypothetical protein
VRLFLEDVDLEGRDEVLATLAQAIASKLDECVASESAAAAAQAVPRLSSQLVDVIERLSGTVREEDEIDRLRRRGVARHLAMAANNNARIHGQAIHAVRASHGGGRPPVRRRVPAGEPVRAQPWKAMQAVSPRGALVATGCREDPCVQGMGARPRAEEDGDASTITRKART